MLMLQLFHVCASCVFKLAPPSMDQINQKCSYFLSLFFDESATIFFIYFQCMKWCEERKQNYEKMT